MLNPWIEALVALFLLAGSLFALVGAIGLYRLPDFFTRLHAPTKATTLGVGGIVVASLIYFSFSSGQVNLHELLITLFLFITAPVSANLLAKAAMQQKVRLHEGTRGRPWEQWASDVAAGRQPDLARSVRLGRSDRLPVQGHIEHAQGEGPLVVVPGQHLDQIALHPSLGQVDHAGRRMAGEVAGNQR